MATVSDAITTRREAHLSGTVCEVDRREMTFQIQPTYKVKVPAPIPEGQLDTVLKAFKSGADGARVTVRGIGKYNRQQQILGFDSVEQVILHEPLEVNSQLDDLRRMKDGWADGMQIRSDWGSGYGKAPSHEGLDWISDKMKREYPDDLPCPRIYPTPEGGVQFEWSIGPHEASLEISFEYREGYWHNLNFETMEDEERELNLHDADSWGWLETKIRRLAGSAE